VRRDLLRGRGGIQRGKRGGGSIRETGVVRLMKVDCPATVALVFADNLEKGHGNQPPCTRDEGIASFVPVEIVLPADDVKEVALAEGQFLGVSVFGLVVVEGFDDLWGSARVSDLRVFRCAKEASKRRMTGVTGFSTRERSGERRLKKGGWKE
jgi:hypothetical protein